MAWALFPALLGWVVGTAAQLQQAALWPWPTYGALVLLALVAYARIAIKNRAFRGRSVVVALVLAGAGLGVAGLRSTLYMTDTLDPALEGRDLLVTGVVASLPQRSEIGVRFRLQVESATLGGQPTRVPPRMDVGWYGSAYAAGPAVAVDGVESSVRSPGAVQAGERWQLVLRLKAPHGSRNPYGFDYELWLWEQGVQATGYVRTSAKDPVPLLLGPTGRYPVALARQLVRERIAQRVPDRQTAGLLAALVVGDQGAIERWRPTLKSLNGFHSQTT